MARLDKHLQNMKKNEKNYDARKISLINLAKQKGVDIEKYWIDSSFDFDKLFHNEEVFRSGDIQNIAIPFSNDMFCRLISMDKKRIGKSIMLKNKAKMVHGIYLMGGSKNRPVIFALSVVRNASEKLKYVDFSIKLDMLVSGKEWLPLCRVDSVGLSHPNYIDRNHRVVSDMSRVRNIEGPHVHINTEQTQVLTDDLSYMTAEPLGVTMRKLDVVGDNTYFKDVLIEVLETCGVGKKVISKSADEGLRFDFYNYVFDYEQEGM